MEFLSTQRRELGLKAKDLLATALYAVMTEKRVIVHIIGDGIIAKKYRNGQIEFHNFQWKNNLPYYPVYYGKRLADFLKAHLDDEGGCLTETVVWIDEKGEVLSENENSHSLMDGIQGNTVIITEDEMKEVEYLTLFSDGVAQVDKVSLPEAVYELMKYKGTGAFAIRRSRVCLRNFARRGRGVLDDFSTATARFVMD